MANNYTETEIKLYVPDLKALAARLEGEGAALSAPRILERNVRYDRADRALYSRRAVLRLREDTRTRLTYKEDPPDAAAVAGVGKTRVEIEVEVSHFEAMELILNRLGFEPYMIYEKYRTTYSLEGADITLDEMPFGNFVEIEGEADTINHLIERLNLETAPRFGVSYTVLFEWVKKHLGLSFNDLTFDNFKGLEVPLSAFEEKH